MAPMDGQNQEKQPSKRLRMSSYKATPVPKMVVPTKTPKSRLSFGSMEDIIAANSRSKASTSSKSFRTAAAVASCSLESEQPISDEENSHDTSAQVQDGADTESGIILGFDCL